MAAKFVKPLVFTICLVPLAWLSFKVIFVGLGANPAQAMDRFLGDWTLRFLLIALAVTPLRGIFGWNILARYRRMLGLFAFFYACLHITSYIVISQFFDWNAIWIDIVKRRYITVGAAVFAILIALAITSSGAMIRRLGGGRWKKLHNLAYLAAAGGVVHYFMMVKADTSQPQIYAAVLFLLLGYRAAVRAVGWTAKKRRPPNRVR